MDHIGQYRILKKLGAGGMGTVLLGEHILLGRRAAIKTLRPELLVQAEIVERFFNEARATSAIADPGVVQIYDFGYSVDGTAYIVMELLEGEGLGARIARLGRLPVADTLRIARQVASSLAAAHERDIIHRDLKPDNVFMIRDPEVDGGERAKLFDFGICKRACDPLLTLPDTMLGTPIYMSPEQCRGAGPVDHRADIYALGCVMFEMLVGEPPFSHDGLGEVIAAHMLVEAPRPSSRCELRGAPARELVDLVDDLVVRCLAKSPDDRFASMGDLIAAIESIDAELAALERPIPFTIAALDSISTLGPGTPVIEPSQLDLLHAREREELATCIFGASRTDDHGTRDEDGVVVTDLAPHSPTVIGIGVAPEVAGAEAPASPTAARADLGSGPRATAARADVDSGARKTATPRPSTAARRQTPPHTRRGRRSRIGSVRGSRKLVDAPHAIAPLGPRLRPEDLEGPRFLRADGAGDGLDEQARRVPPTSTRGTARPSERPLPASGSGAPGDVHAGAPPEPSHSDRWFAEGDAASGSSPQLRASAVDRWIDHDRGRWSLRRVALAAVALSALIGVYMVTRDVPEPDEVADLTPAPRELAAEEPIAPAVAPPTTAAPVEAPLAEPVREPAPATIAPEAHDTWFGPPAPADGAETIDEADVIEMEPATVREPTVTAKTAPARTQLASRPTARRQGSSANPAGSAATMRHAGAGARHASSSPRTPSGATQGLATARAVAPVTARPPGRTTAIGGSHPQPDAVLANPWTEHPDPWTDRPTQWPALNDRSGNARPAAAQPRTEDLYDTRW